MIDVEMYGMMFSVKMLKWCRVLFENMLNMFMMLLFCVCMSVSMVLGLMFGIGI